MIVMAIVNNTIPALKENARALKLNSNCISKRKKKIIYFESPHNF